MRRAERRAGVTCLEIQVSLAVLGIALAGLCPLIMMQMKLLRRIESTPIGSDNPQVIRGQRVVDGQLYVAEGDVGTPQVKVLQPAADLWARRLGTAAPFQDSVAYQPSIPLLTEATLDDPAAVFVGTWAVQTLDDALAGACRASASGNPNDSATWTYGPITPGVYRVMISWPVSVPIPSDATFTIVDALSNELVITSNQATQIDGGPWRDLGNYSLGTSLQFRVRGSSVGTVLADAVRIGPRNVVTISALNASDTPSSSVGAGRRATVLRLP